MSLLVRTRSHCTIAVAVAPGFKQVEHTADLAIELWGDSEEDILLQGARAVVGVMTEADGATTSGPRQPGRAGQRTVHIASIDRANRLVQWLNAAIVAAITDGFLFQDADIILDGDAGLTAQVRGRAEAGAGVVTELKSATYHDLMLTRAAGGEWRARVVIDV